MFTVEYPPITGSFVASSGKVQYSVTATTRSPAPTAKRISVFAGAREMIL